ncbi:MAG TPA: hypothetical protein VJ455_09250, partial [Ignavibacteria bacterium]|nr:hypothetical protein [Ignavibacteria bacterium]
KPAYSLLLNLCYNSSLLELSGSNSISENIYEGKTFGAGTGFGATVISKIPLGSKSDFVFSQALSFNRMLSYDFGKEQYDIGEANYNAISLSVGFEYNFTPRKKYNIYGGAEMNANLIDGNSKIWFQRIGHPLGDSVASYNFNSSFRIGYGLNFGADYKVNNKFGFNLGFRFLNLNAFLKQSEGTNDDAEFQLRDDTANDLIFAGNKNFAFFSVNCGVSLYFGENGKMLK